MGKIKALYMDKIDEILKDYTDSIIGFTEALIKLNKLGYDPLDASDMLDDLRELRLFPDATEVTFSGGLTYGSAKDSSEKKGQTDGKQEQETSHPEGSSPKDST